MQLASSMLRQASRWLLGRIVPPHDLEKQGHNPEVYHSNVLDEQRDNRLTVITTAEGALIPPNDKLLVFRSLTGIDTVPTLSSSGHASRVAPNLGIYPRVVQAERSSGRGYRFFNIAVNGCLGAQIIVAAALTALGAANGSRTAVTAFGAINTIIAGLLTYLKGTGLPNRLKYVEDEFKAVREYIEQREREFCLADCPLNPQEEVQIIDEMYHSAKQDMDGNKSPGRSNSTAQHTRTASSMLSPVVQRLSKFAESSTSTRVPVSDKQ